MIQIEMMQNEIILTILGGKKPQVFLRVGLGIIGGCNSDMVQFLSFHGISCAGMFVKLIKTLVFMKSA